MTHEPDPFVREFMLGLAQSDALFQNPRAAATTVSGTMAEIDPSIRFLGRLAENDPRRADVPGDPEAALLFRTNKGRDFYVYEGVSEVWMDVSRLGQGDEGSAIYMAVADYAKNTRQTFIGDPTGLSFIALIRRTENMLSSALKHGGTAHLAPHADQVAGNTAAGMGQ